MPVLKRASVGSIKVHGLETGLSRSCDVQRVAALPTSTFKASQTLR